MGWLPTRERSLGSEQLIELTVECVRFAPSLQSRGWRACDSRSCRQVPNLIPSSAATLHTGRQETSASWTAVFFNGLPSSLPPDTIIFFPALKSALHTSVWLLIRACLEGVKKTVKLNTSFCIKWSQKWHCPGHASFYTGEQSEKILLTDYSPVTSEISEETHNITRGNLQRLPQ